MNGNSVTSRMKYVQHVYIRYCRRQYSIHTMSYEVHGQKNNSKIWKHHIDNGYLQQHPSLYEKSRQWCGCFLLTIQTEKGPIKKINDALALSTYEHIQCFAFELVKFCEHQTKQTHNMTKSEAKRERLPLSRVSKC